MYLDRLVELAPAEDIFANPQHPYTRLLLDTIPDIGMKNRDLDRPAGEVPNPITPPSGCHFHPRCCQAAVQVAMTLAARFSIVTTLPRSVPIIEDLADADGVGRRCRRVRAIDLPVLALEEDPATARRLLRAEILLARDQDGAEAVILGCAGMAELCDWLTAETGMPVIDGVTAAVKQAEAIVGMGYRTAKTGAYGWPRAKRGGLNCEVA